MLRLLSLLLACFLFASCTTNVPATPPIEPLVPASALSAGPTLGLPAVAAANPSTSTATLLPTRIPTTPTPTRIVATPTRVAPTLMRAAATAIRVTATPTRAAATPTLLSALPTRTRVMELRKDLRPTSDLTILLPDLRMLEPTDLQIQVTPEQQRLLRLTNYIINWGPGKLEILGKSDTVSERTVVMQHIFRANGSYTERPAGIYVFHPLHNHWHFENFAVYQLWSLTVQGEPDETVAVMDKVSYCLRDTGRSVLGDAALAPLYTECEAALQGINAGWIDSYEYDLPGQTIDITDLPDGVYALECSVDPGDRLLEQDETNNSAVIYIEIRGAQVEVLSRESALERLAE